MSPDDMTQPEFLTRTEVARWLKLHPQSLANMASRHQGPKFLRTGRLQGRALYRRSDVLAWLEANVSRRDPVTKQAPRCKPTQPRRRKAGAK